MAGTTVGGGELARAQQPAEAGHSFDMGTVLHGAGQVLLATARGVRSVPDVVAGVTNTALAGVTLLDRAFVDTRVQYNNYLAERYEREAAAHNERILTMWTEGSMLALDARKAYFGEGGVLDMRRAAVNAALAENAAAYRRERAGYIGTGALSGELWDAAQTNWSKIGNRFSKDRPPRR